MTPRDVMRRYLGWCPRYPILTHLVPFTSFPTGGKIGFVSLLIVWGLGSLYQGLTYLVVNIPQWRTILTSPSLTGLFLQEVLILPFGLSLVILVADYSVTGRVLKRHEIELLATAIIGSFSRVANSLFDIVLWLQGGLDWARFALWVSLPQNILYAIIADSYVVILVFFCAYLAKRVLTNRSILSAGVFMLLAANYLWVGFDWFWINLIQPSLNSVQNPLYVQVWYVQASVVLDLVANLLFGVFLLRVYSGLRHTDHLEVSASIVLRCFFIFYATFSIFYRLVSYSMYASGSPWDYPWLAAAGLVADLAIILVAVYPPRLNIVDVKEMGT